MKRLFGKNPAATDIESREIATQEASTDMTHHTRLGWWIVIAGLGGFVLWASLAPLDKGVPLSGTVTVWHRCSAPQHRFWLT